MREKKVFLDMLHREVSIPFPPKRIVSLVPSQTEFLIDLGLEKELVGRTKFCIHPKEKTKGIPQVGGTKRFHHERVRALAPDLIIANKEENTKEDIEQLALSYPVWASDIQDLKGALGMMRQIGTICDKKEQAEKIITKIAVDFDGLKDFNKRKALYFIWRKPYMLAGQDTFINEMMHYAGFENVLKSDRYPQSEAHELRQYEVDDILLSSEPYPFNQSHIEELRQIFPKANILLVDGESFSWYGSRLLHAAAYFKNLRSEMP